MLVLNLNVYEKIDDEFVKYQQRVERERKEFKDRFGLDEF